MGQTKTEKRDLASRLQDTAFWRLKVKLQFTGWLQYIPTGLASVVLLAIAGVGRQIGAWTPLTVWVPGLLGLGLLIRVLFDLVTVKLGVHPPEHVPPRPEFDDAFDLMRSRRSCRAFQSRNLTDDHRRRLMDEVARQTGPQALIGRERIRFEYVAAPLTVWPVVGAHEFLVAIAPQPYDRMAVIDVGRSLQKVVLAATALGIATCWIGPGADQRSIAEHLGDRFDPERDHVICVCAVGYRSRYEPLMVRAMEFSQHRRLPISTLFSTDARLTRPVDVDALPYSRFAHCFEACQWSPSSYNGQPTRGVAVADGTRLSRLDFYASTASRYYAPVALGIWCADWETGCGQLGASGHFEVRPELEAEDPSHLPRYDVSWVADAV